MCKKMCEEREVNFFCPERSLLVDNAAMIAYLGEIIYNKEKKCKNSQKLNLFSSEDLDKVDIFPRQRTDDIIVNWK
jgi:tRNA A37 threonylcarbamoyltransferase TsaD